MDTSETSVPGQASDSEAFSSDRPIETDADDKLGRRQFADVLTKQISAAPRAGSCVFGLLGPWGCGKSSVLNLIESRLRARTDVVVIRFNPWLFSGAEQLVAHFFQEIAGQLREQAGQPLKAVWRAFEIYSRLFANLRLVPDHGEISSPTQASVPSAAAQRQSLRRALSQSTHRLVIILDDIDRLRQDEIRDVMRLVRLVGDFPNTTYLLAFDRQRVEKALDSEDEGGRAYLEKIIQVAHDLPEIRHSDVVSILGSKIDHLINTKSDKSASNWTEVRNLFSLVISPMFSSLRDVSRYINALNAAFDTFGDELALGDLLALESLRCIKPETYAYLPSIENILAPKSLDHKSQVQGAPDLLETFFRTAGVHKDIVKTLCKRLFPACRRYLDNYHYDSHVWQQQWRREGRVAHNDVFRIYLERSIAKTSFSRSHIRRIFSAFESEISLRALLSEVEDTRLEELLKRLEDYEVEYKPTMLEAATPALLDLLPRLPVGSRHAFDPGASMALDRVVLRLIRAEKDDSARERMVPIIFSKTNSLSAKKKLWNIVTPQDGHSLVSEQTASNLVSKLITDAISLSADDLALERDLDYLVALISQKGDQAARQKIVELMKNDKLLTALLRSDLFDAHALSFGDVVGRVQYQLPIWDELEELLGASILAERIDQLRALIAAQKMDERTSLAIAVAGQYRAGWRPLFYSKRTTAASETGPATADPTEEPPEGASPGMPTEQDEARGLRDDAQEPSEGASQDVDIEQDETRGDDEEAVDKEAL